MQCPSKISTFPMDFLSKNISIHSPRCQALRQNFLEKLEKILNGSKGGASAPPCVFMIYYFILSSVDCTYLSKICFLRCYTLNFLWTVPAFHKMKIVKFMCTSDDTSLSTNFVWFWFVTQSNVPLDCTFLFRSFKNLTSWICFFGFDSDGFYFPIGPYLPFLVWVSDESFTFSLDRTCLSFCFLWFVVVVSLFVVLTLPHAKGIVNHFLYFF